MKTIIILASKQDEAPVDQFWKHTVMLRRTTPNITWVQPLFTEDLVSSQALVPAQETPFIIIGCMSVVFLAQIFEQPAIRELIEQAQIRMPLILSPCAWNDRPSPFAGLYPLNDQAISQTSSKDAAFFSSAQRLGASLKEK
jgi:hypothetical protein